MKRLFEEEKKKSEPVICSICLETFSYCKGTLNCSHYFHIKCIKELTKTSNHCPLCREEFNFIEQRTMPNRSDNQFKATEHFINMNSTTKARDKLQDNEMSETCGGFKITQDTAFEPHWTEREDNLTDILDKQGHEAYIESLMLMDQDAIASNLHF